MACSRCPPRKIWVGCGHEGYGRKKQEEVAVDRSGKADARNEINGKILSTQNLGGT